MGNQIRQIVPFTAVAAAGTDSEPHNINVNGVPIIPDEMSLDNADFEITAVTSTSITVQNNGAAPGNCNVLCKLWYSSDRAFGASTVPGSINAGLTPRPFISAPQAASGGGGITPEVRTWVFGEINQSLPALGTQLADSQTLFWSIIQSLLLVPGVTVAGSSDSITGAMDGVNRWVAPANLIWGGNFDPKSWIVLQFGNLGNMQWLISCQPLAATNSVFHAIAETPFTGGDESTKPASGTQRNTGNTNVSVPVGDNYYILHVIYTDDGEQARVLVMNAGLVIGMLSFGTFDYTDATFYPKPYFMGSAWSDNLGVGGASWAAWNGQAPIIPITGPSSSGFLSGEYYGFDPPGSGIAGPTFYNNSLWALLCQNAWISAGSGLAGGMAQQYWPSTIWVTGDSTTLDDGSRFVVFGQIAFPWGAADDVWIDNSGPFIGTDYDSFVQRMIG